MTMRCVMRSKKDQAIEESILKQHVVQTFFNNVYIRKPDDAIIAHSAEDFMRQLTDPCHFWTGSQSFNGYGYWSVYSLKFNCRVSIKAHRFAYAYAYGIDALPSSDSGLVLNHICHNRLCVNVKHLEVITHAENLSKDKRKPTNV